MSLDIIPRRHHNQHILSNSNLDDGREQEQLQIFKLKCIVWIFLPSLRHLLAPNPLWRKEWLTNGLKSTENISKLASLDAGSRKSGDEGKEEISCFTIGLKKRLWLVGSRAIWFSTLWKCWYWYLQDGMTWRSSRISEGKATITRSFVNLLPDSSFYTRDD